jgi:acyl carrier protein
MASTFDQIKKIIVRELGVGDDVITPEVTLDVGLSADSLDRINLRMAVEDAFAIDIPDDEADRILTVGDLVAVVDRKLAKGSAA